MPEAGKMAVLDMKASLDKVMHFSTIGLCSNLIDSIRLVLAKFA